MKFFFIIQIQFILILINSNKLSWVLSALSAVLILGFSACGDDEPTIVLADASAASRAPLGRLPTVQGRALRGAAIGVGIGPESIRWRNRFGRWT